MVSTLLVMADEQAEEIIRSAEAHADLIRAEADRYAANRRREADELREQAERQFVSTQERALAVKASAEQQAAAIVRSAEHRARYESNEILDQARRQLARLVEGARPARGLPIVSGTDLGPFGRRTPGKALRRRATDVIDLRAPAPAATLEPGAAVAAAAADRDPLDAMVGEAVTKAVRRAIDPQPVRAGRRA
jgi:hypothetical protein